MKRIGLLLLVLTGCAAPTGGGIQQMGPDTFTLSAIAHPAVGGASGARNFAIEEANKFCASRGQLILVTSTEGRRVSPGGAGSADIVFKCLPPGDREFTRQDYRPPPSNIDEGRRR